MRYRQTYSKFEMIDDPLLVRSVDRHASRKDIVILHRSISLCQALYNLFPRKVCSVGGVLCQAELDHRQMHDPILHGLLKDGTMARRRKYRQHFETSEWLIIRLCRPSGLCMTHILFHSIELCPQLFLTWYGLPSRSPDDPRPADGVVLHHARILFPGVHLTQHLVPLVKE
jgi:hypothetical protein